MSWRHSGQVRSGWQHCAQQQTWPQLRKIIWACGESGGLGSAAAGPEPLHHPKHAAGRRASRPALCERWALLHLL